MALTRSLWSRALLLLNVRTSAALDEAEDPQEVMDYAYNQQLELARRVRRGVVEVATARRQLELQMERLQARIPRLEAQARQALDTGREDLAKRALERKHQTLTEIETLERRAGEVRGEEEQLRQAQQRLNARVDAFRARRNMVSARQAAYGAHAQARQALFGLSDELTQLDLAVIRAEEKTERLQAQATVLEVVVEELDPTGAGADAAGDSLEQELRAVSVEKAVAAELEALKRKASSA